MKCLSSETDIAIIYTRSLILYLLYYYGQVTRLVKCSRSRLRQNDFCGKMLQTCRKICIFKVAGVLLPLANELNVKVANTFQEKKAHKIMYVKYKARQRV